MPSNVLFLSEEEIESCKNWQAMFTAIKQTMSDVSFKNPHLIQPPRGIMMIPHKSGALLTMPGLSERNKVLSCKIVTSFTNNPSQHQLPSVLANILLFDADTGKLKAVLEGTTITEWRTAVASAVATQVLRPNVGKNQTLAVFGAGRQGRMHIIAFQEYFKFSKVNLWNRTHEKAVKLAEELKTKYNITVQVYINKDECAKDADVIVTATYSSDPLLKLSSLKKKVLINAIGAGINHHSELDQSVYEKSSIYTDSMENARIELKGLIDAKYLLLGEVGELINGLKKITENDVIIFHSLGMALEDGVTANLVLNKFLSDEEKDKI